MLTEHRVREEAAQLCHYDFHRRRRGRKRDNKTVGSSASSFDLPLEAGQQRGGPVNSDQAEAARATIANITGHYKGKHRPAEVLLEVRSCLCQAFVRSN